MNIVQTSKFIDNIYDIVSHGLRNVSIFFYFLRSLGPEVLKDSRVPPYESWCAREDGQRGGISLIYPLLLDSSVKLPYMRAWDTDLVFGEGPGPLACLLLLCL